MGNLSLKLDKKYLIVSGSNISQLNGLYIKSNIVSGKNRYIKTPSVNYLGLGNFSIEWNPGFPDRWIIRTTIFTGGYYYAPYDTISPDLASLWLIDQNGGDNILVNVFSGNTSIKKQDLSKLQPDILYRFIGGSPNTLSTVFNYLEFQAGSNSTAADIIIIQGLNFFYHSTNNRWQRGLTDETNRVINPNDTIFFAPKSQKEISVASGAIVQKLNSGKLNLNKKNISIPVSQRFVNVNWGSLLGVGLTNLTLDNNGLYPSDIAWAGYFNNPTEKEIVLAYNYNIPNTWEFSIFDPVQVYPSYHWRNASTDTSKIPLEGWVGINDENFSGGNWPLTAGTTNLFITSV